MSNQDRHQDHPYLRSQPTSARFDANQFLESFRRDLRLLKCAMAATIREAVLREAVPLASRENTNRNLEAKPQGDILSRLKGGAARAKVLTPEQRSEIARKAVVARWAKKKQS